MLDEAFHSKQFAMLFSFLLTRGALRNMCMFKKKQFEFSISPIHVLIRYRIAISHWPLKNTRGRKQKRGRKWKLKASVYCIRSSVPKFISQLQNREKPVKKDGNEIAPLAEFVYIIPFNMNIKCRFLRNFKNITDKTPRALRVSNNGEFIRGPKYLLWKKKEKRTIRWK